MLKRWQDFRGLEKQKVQKRDYYNHSMKIRCKIGQILLSHSIKELIRIRSKKLVKQATLLSISRISGVPVGHGRTKFTHVAVEK